MRKLRKQMDRFNSDYHYIRFPDPQERQSNTQLVLDVGEIINVGEEILDVYGVCVHDKYDCLFKSVDAKRLIAGEE